MSVPAVQDFPAVTGTEASRKSTLNWHLWALLGITLAAGILRFATIQRPPVWGDEGATFWRCCGTYRQMLDILQNDGFPPLHYELYWTLHKLPLAEAVIRGGLGCVLGLLVLAGIYLWMGKLAGRGARGSMGILGGTVVWVVTWSLLRHPTTAHHLLRWAWLICVAGALAIAYPLARAFLRRPAALVAAVISGAGTGVMLYGLTRVGQLTPPVLRFVPALAGTLMVPAMYFLASRMVKRTTCLVVAIFTAISAYMMVYSHDAKMYMPLWLLGTLNAACLISWLAMLRHKNAGRQQRQTLAIAWLAWIATGVAAVGFHSSGWMVLAVAPIIFLSYWRLHWLGPILLVIGMTVPAAASLGHYLGFNRWAEKIEERGWSDSGIDWVKKYNEGRSSADLVLFAITAHLYSWEWPGHQDFGPIKPWVNKGLKSSGVVLLLLAGLGAMPWRKGKKPGPRPNSPCPPSWPAHGVPGAGTEEYRWRAKEGIASPPQPWWRCSLWLISWMIIPGYAFYCWSVPHFASPVSWLNWVASTFHGLYPVNARLHWGENPDLSIWWFIALQVVALAAVCHTWPKVAFALAILLVSLPVIAFLYFYARSGLSFGFVAGGKWLDFMARPQVLGLLAGILPPMCWFYCGKSLASRMRRTLELGGLIAIVWMACFVAYWAWMILSFQPQVAKMILDGHDNFDWDDAVAHMLATHGGAVELRQRWDGLVQSARRNQTTLNIHWQDQATNKAMADHWLGLMTTTGKKNPEVPTDQIEALAAQTLAAEHLAAEERVWDAKWENKWMPRYLGVLWPALAIAICSLLLRLPTFPLRWGAVVFFLALNGVQTGARLCADTEPPWDRIAMDMRDGQLELANKPTNSATRTYLLNMEQPLNAHPGHLGTNHVNARYYFSLINGATPTPNQFRPFGEDSATFHNVFKIWLNRVYSTRQIAVAVKDDPSVRKVIVWQSYPIARRGDGQTSAATAETLSNQLGSGWKLTETQVYAGRMHWMWQELYTCYRRVYVRQ